MSMAISPTIFYSVTNHFIIIDVKQSNYYFLGPGSMVHNVKQEVSWHSYFSPKADPLLVQNPIRKWLFCLKDQSLTRPFITRGHREVSLHQTQKKPCRQDEKLCSTCDMDLVNSILPRPKAEKQIPHRSTDNDSVFSGKFCTIADIKFEHFCK